MYCQKCGNEMSKITMQVCNKQGYECYTCGRMIWE